MQLKKLKLENFMGHESKTIDLQDVNIIKGPNQSGKTSLLKGIKVALSPSGEKLDLVRNGEEYAVVKAKMDDGLVIERTIKPNEAKDKFSLTRDGSKITKPQTYLDSLYRGSQLDPIAFMELSPKDQVKELLHIWPLDDIKDNLFKRTKIYTTSKDTIGQIKETRKGVYEARTELNSEIKTKKAHVLAAESEIDEDFDPNKWDGTDMNSLIEEQREAAKKNTERHNKLSRVYAAKNRIEALRKELVDLEKEIETLTAEAGEIIDIEGSTEKIESYNEHKTQLRQYEYIQTTNAEIAELEDLSARKTKGLAWLDQLPTDLLAKRVQIPGVKIIEGEMHLQDSSGNFVLSTNASEANRLMYGVRIAKCAAPEEGIKVILVDGGERCDKKTKDQLVKLALAEPKFQLIMAEVADTGDLEIKHENT